MGSHWKTQFLGGRFHEKTIYRADYLKRGAWTVCRFKWEFGKKEGGVFEWGDVTPMHTIWSRWGVFRHFPSNPTGPNLYKFQ